MKKTMTARFASKQGGLQGIDSNIEWHEQEASSIQCNIRSPESY